MSGTYELPAGSPALADDYSATVERVLEAIHGLMHRLAWSRAPEFLEIPVTMPQAKVLFLVGTAGSLRMSVLAGRLGVSLPTVSGIVERLVEAGLVDRHDDPADRRQVLLAPTPAGASLVDRFTEFNAGDLRRLLEALDGPGLALVEQAIRLLADAARERDRT